MEVRNTGPAMVPHPDAFRPWVQDCLATLGISAAGMSRELGLGRNTVGDFLGKPGRSIDMTTAHKLTCKLRELAAAKPVVLPRLGAVVAPHDKRVAANG